jgi:hypothetical protein
LVTLHVIRIPSCDVLIPAFGHKFIDAVTAADVRELMPAIEKRDAKDVAKRSHETTSQIFGLRLLAISPAETQQRISSPGTSWPKPGPIRCGAY